MFLFVQCESFKLISFISDERKLARFEIAKITIRQNVKGFLMKQKRAAFEKEGLCWRICLEFHPFNPTLEKFTKFFL